MVICTTPDVCKTPPSGVPVPYPIVGFLQDHLRESPSVRFHGKWAMTMNSRVTKVTGNEAGAMGGVVSGVNMNYCRPITFSPTVNVNSHPILFHEGTDMFMNCAGPEGPGNTVGKLLYCGPAGGASMGPDGPPPGDPDLVPEIPLEEGFIGKLLSVDGIAGLAQMAPQLATMDWSNPMSALGAIGGICGLGGLDTAGQLMGLASQAGSMLMGGGKSGGSPGAGGLGAQLATAGNAAASLVTANWSNPGSILGAAGNLAGVFLSRSR